MPPRPQPTPPASAGPARPHGSGKPSRAERKRRRAAAAGSDVDGSAGSDAETAGPTPRAPPAPPTPPRTSGGTRVVAAAADVAAARRVRRDVSLEFVADADASAGGDRHREGVFRFHGGAVSAASAAARSATLAVSFAHRHGHTLGGVQYEHTVFCAAYTTAVDAAFGADVDADAEPSAGQAAPRRVLAGYAQLPLPRDGETVGGRLRAALDVPRRQLRLAFTRARGGKSTAPSADDDGDDADDDGDEVLLTAAFDAATAAAMAGAAPGDLEMGVSLYAADATVTDVLWTGDTR